MTGSATGFFWAKGSHPRTTPSTVTPEGTFIPFHWPVVWLQFPFSARLFHVGREMGRDVEAKAVLGHSTLPVVGGVGSPPKVKVILIKSARSADI